MLDNSKFEYSTQDGSRDLYKSVVGLTIDDLKFGSTVLQSTTDFDNISITIDDLNAIPELRQIVDLGLFNNRDSFSISNFDDLTKIEISMIFMVSAGYATKYQNTYLFNRSKIMTLFDNNETIKNHLDLLLEIPVPSNLIVLDEQTISFDFEMNLTGVLSGDFDLEIIVFDHNDLIVGVSIDQNIQLNNQIRTFTNTIVGLVPGNYVFAIFKTTSNKYIKPTYLNVEFTSNAEIILHDEDVSIRNYNFFNKNNLNGYKFKKYFKYKVLFLDENVEPQNVQVDISNLNKIDQGAMIGFIDIGGTLFWSTGGHKNIFVDFTGSTIEIPKTASLKLPTVFYTDNQTNTNYIYYAGQLFTIDFNTNIINLLNNGAVSIQQTQTSFSQGTFLDPNLLRFENNTILREQPYDELFGQRHINIPQTSSGRIEILSLLFDIFISYFNYSGKAIVANGLDLIQPTHSLGDIMLSGKYGKSTLKESIPKNFNTYIHLGGDIIPFSNGVSSPFKKLLHTKNMEDKSKFISEDIYMYFSQLSDVYENLISYEIQEFDMKSDRGVVSIKQTVEINID